MTHKSYLVLCIVRGGNRSSKQRKLQAGGLHHPMSENTSPTRVLIITVPILERQHTLPFERFNETGELEIISAMRLTGAPVELE